MYKKLFGIMAVFCVLAFAGSAIAGMPTWWNVNTGAVIHYDGYLQQDVDPGGIQMIYADTLIVVTNSSLGAVMQAEIDVFDKYGNAVIENAKLLDGGQTISTIPASGFGWICLAQLVGRTTNSPYGTPADPDGLAEKFTYRIWTDRPGGAFMPVVEVKQFVYSIANTLIEGGPYYGPWEPSNFTNWTETSLGGKAGTGVIWP